MTAVLAAWWGLPLAVLLTNVAFGLGHAYQGREGMLKTGLVGFVMSGIVLATGSLVPAMILHAIIDLGGGADGAGAAGGSPGAGDDADLVPMH
jgi:membrane protease YdiL (CAAX protease family)